MTTSDVAPHEYSWPFLVPFIRWADVAPFAPGQAAPSQRRIYDHEFVYVLSGAGHITIQGASHQARPDRLFLVQPRLWHSYRADENQSLALPGVHFDWAPQADTLRFPVFRAVESEGAIDSSLFRQAQSVAGWDLETTPFLDLRGRPLVRRALENGVAEYAREDAVSRRGAARALCWRLRSRKSSAKPGDCSLPSAAKPQAPTPCAAWNARANSWKRPVKCRLESKKSLPEWVGAPIISGARFARFGTLRLPACKPKRAFDGRAN